MRAVFNPLVRPCMANSSGGISQIKWKTTDIGIVSLAYRKGQGRSSNIQVRVGSLSFFVIMNIIRLQKNWAAH